MQYLTLKKTFLFSFFFIVSAGAFVLVAAYYREKERMLDPQSEPAAIIAEEASTIPGDTPLPLPAVETPPTSDTVEAKEIYRPKPGTRFHWQLSDSDVSLDHPAHIYDLDLFETDAKTVAALHKRGKKVFCYISAGTTETYRPDAKNFPSSVIGKKLDDWPDERYLDIRRIDLIGPLMKKRMDLCLTKGFDGIEPDNIDASLNKSGFPLTLSDQLRYNRFLASAAHERGLSIGLKNAPEMAAALAEDFDWAITEECALYDECAAFSPFIKRGKAVVEIEYTDTDVKWAKVCKNAKALGFTAILKHRDLDAWSKDCF